MITQDIPRIWTTALNASPPVKGQLKALLFDLDGTLYPLRPVRMAVLGMLVTSYLFHPSTGFRTIRALAPYRRSQELLRTAKCLPGPLREAQLQTASQLSGLTVEFINGCVSDWMEERPLEILAHHVRKDLIRVLRSAKERGIRTAVCSDYPANRKIAALGLTEWFDLVVSAQDPAIGEFKPSPRMLEFTLEKLGVLPEQALYIGDRAEIDGAAARRAGVAVNILHGHQDFREFMLEETSGFRMVPLSSRQFDSESAATVSALVYRPLLRAHIEIARPDHWIKNVFILPGIVAALAIDRTSIHAIHLGHIFIGLFAYCLTASSNYVLNELQDAPFDQFHPVKSQRPVPSGQVNLPLAYAEWILLMVAGLGLGLMISLPFTSTLVALWVMGCVYNLPPLRTKDLPYVDVLSEAVNNPIRMLGGWYLTLTTAIPPLSLLLTYWMAGCFFMAIKRFAEFREINDPARSAAYRRSFQYYTEPRLLISIIFYAAQAMLFFGAFLMRYRVELILAFPLIALVMAQYFALGFDPHSAAQHPEKLYRNNSLMASVVLCTVVLAILMFLHLPILNRIFAPTLMR